MSDLPVVIVTGTSSGLGAALATHLANGGYRVVGLSRRPVDASELGLDARRYAHTTCDLGDIDAIPALVSDIVAEHGTPYGLINNAASGADGVLPTMHNSEIQQVVAVNVTAPIVLTKYVCRRMLAQQTGRIVNVSSIVARTGYRGLAAYGATKAAMEGFTRSLARDLGRRNVTVNAVAPGFLDTEMTNSLGADQLARIRQRAALRRFATVDEVAASVAFLMSPEAAGITGTVVTVDGGTTA